MVVELFTVELSELGKDPEVSENNLTRIPQLAPGGNRLHDPRAFPMNNPASDKSVIV